MKRFVRVSLLYWSYPTCQRTKTKPGRRVKQSRKTTSRIVLKTTRQRDYIDKRRVESNQAEYTNSWDKTRDGDLSDIVLCAKFGNHTRLHQLLISTFSIRELTFETFYLGFGIPKFGSSFEAVDAAKKHGLPLTPIVSTPGGLND